MVFNSFLPPQGYIKSVCIYPSDFGLKAMEEENKYGPRVWKDSSNDDDANNLDDKGFDVKKLRTYEYNRLRYYFAVIECDSVNTAYHLYKNLDSHEIENTSNKMDLRFIPDNISFEGRQIKDKADEIPANYKPPQFETKSVFTTGLHLSWDQTPSDRQFLTRQKFTKEQLRDLDFRAYLADASSDDESNEEEREKYSKLLEGIDIGDDEENQKEDMEIVFTTKNIELDEKVKELVDKKLNKDRTVFDELMAKERKKKKEKRERKLAEKYGVEYLAHDDSEEEEWDRDDYDEKPKKKKKNKKNKRKLRDSNDENDSDNESHKPSKKKDKKGTDTEVDLTDERFNRLITDPKFHIDPTHPLYKKSKTTEKILKEREKYRKKSRK